MRKTILLVVLLSLFMVGFTAMDASAAPPCTGMSCNGKDPRTTGCDVGATTMDSFLYSTHWYFELRYSSLCNAVWTRLGTSVNGWCTSTIFGQIRGYDLTTHALKISYGVQAPCPGGKVWTKMISFPNYWVRTCKSSWFSGAVQVCTNEH